MNPRTLRVEGAGEHNLREVTAEVPHGKLVVVCGVSGSGKTSLVFDTIHAESQRRFVESLSSFVRAQVGQAPRPVYEQMTGLLPSIGVAQRTGGAASVRATVATSAELYDLFRVLYARAATLHCCQCGDSVHVVTVDEIVRRLLTMPEGTPATVLAPLAERRSGPLLPLFRELASQGFLRVRVDGATHLLDEPPPAGAGPFRVELVVDRVKLGPERAERVQEAVASALKAGRGTLTVETDGDRLAFATRPFCARCHRELPVNSPRLYSFNSPVGACRTCQGTGVTVRVDPERVVLADRSLADGAVLTWPDAARPSLLRWASERGISTELPWSRLPWEQRELLLSGEGAAEGILKTAARKPDERWTVEKTCEACAGTRLGPDARASRLHGVTLPERLAQTIVEGRARLAQVPRSPITSPLLDELDRRLAFLDRVGLGYLTLDRATTGLSGGEAQRLRLGAQVGNPLSGVLYVLDEPTAGLHPHDTARLVTLLRELVDGGNTVLVVEHDPEVVAAADHVIEIGPGAGREGGCVVFTGSPADLLRGDTLTGRWLSGRDVLPPHARLPPRGWLRLRGMSGRHLHGDLELPLGNLVAVSGPSGAGKSSCLFDTLVPALTDRPGLPFKSLEGRSAITRVVRVDGASLPKAGRSTVATASKVFEPMRQLLAGSPEAKVRGFGPERFSTAVTGGRCEACQGEGVRRVAMVVLPDVSVRCEVCDGRRYDDATLAVTYKGYNAADILELSVAQARPVFGPVASIAGVLATLDALGLGYVTLGQSVDSLSGGEAQRLKLARELGKPGEVSGTLYVLDEPSVGLHPADVALLVEALRRLVSLGASVVVVEHDPGFIGASDWEVRLGPGAGSEGGRVVRSAPPDQSPHT